MNDSPALGTTRSRPPVWLWLSLPIALLALAASLAGVFVDETYAKETENWAGQAVGQDIANLVAYPVMLLLALAAGRGSVRAYLAWTGVVAYSAYTFAIYAFAVNFSRLFLVYVAVFGLSVYALIGGLSALDPALVRSRFGRRTPIRSTAVLLIGIGSMFYLLWLSEVVGAIVSNETPAATVEAGLMTSPVHVLDMGVLLPAAIAAGVLLLRRRVWGHVLAPTVLGALVFISVGIVAAMVVLAERGLEASAGVGLVIGVLTVVEVVVLVRFLRAIDPAADSFLRPTIGP
jgi:hypothetical protein